MLAALPSSTRKHLLGVIQQGAHRYVARFNYFSKPTPETVFRHFEKVGCQVRRWHVVGNVIEVFFEEA